MRPQCTKGGGELKRTGGQCGSAAQVLIQSLRAEWRVFRAPSALSQTRGLFVRSCGPPKLTCTWPGEPARRGATPQRAATPGYLQRMDWIRRHRLAVAGGLRAPYGDIRSVITLLGDADFIVTQTVEAGWVGLRTQAPPTRLGGSLLFSGRWRTRKCPRGRFY